MRSTPKQMDRPQSSIKKTNSKNPNIPTSKAIVYPFFITSNVNNIDSANIANAMLMAASKYSPLKANWNEVL